VATYTVKAPDGKTVTLSGPDGASQADIIAQAQALYKPQAAPPKSAPRRAPAPNAFLDKYNTIRNGLAAGETDPQKRQYALNRFDSDPRAQQLRKAAGLAPLSTRQGEVQAVARKQSQQRTLSDLVTGDSPEKRFQKAGTDIGQGSTGFQSAAAGIARGMFGIPEIVAAAGERFLPSALTGNRTDASFHNILQLIRAKDTAAIDAHPVAGTLGELGGGVVGVGGAGKLVMGGARRLAATGVPAVARVARAVESVGTLRKGQKLANAAKLVTTGAAAGGAQATGEGSDPLVGAVEGAAAVPVVAGGFKAAQVISRPFRDVLQMTSASRLLRRLTTATRDQLEAKAATYRQATGAEPTLFELLPLADRNKILKSAVVGKDDVVEQASNAIRGRAKNLGPEMSARAQQILQPNRTKIQAGITQDIMKARGGQLAPGDQEMIANAMDNATDMRRLRKAEASAIMAPHDATPVVPNLEDLFPHVPGPNGTRVSVDPEVATVIRSAAGTLRARPQDAGVTAGDITDMISTLKGDLGKGGIEGRTADRAINHLHDTLDQLAPEAGAAAREMSDAYAARSRMLEGMKEGAQTRLRSDVYPDSRAAARKIENAYDTPEGTTGRALGQGNRALSDLGGSPEEALRATVKQSRGSTGRQLEQNIGGPEAEQLVAAANAQDESAQALAAASAKAQSGSGDGADAEMLVQAIAGLHPSSFITTKAGAVRRLLDMTYIPANKARTIVDMIFSQDPAMTRRALRAVGNEPNGATFLKYLAGATGVTAAKAGGAPSVDVPGDFSAADTTPTAESDLAGLEEQPASDEETPAATDSPYAAQLQAVYDNENPDLIDLVQRVKHQESRGDQSAVSPAGAIGIMQVMPDTAPEAATLAGLPWDPEAFHKDAAYNELLGIAYLSSLLHKYDGDVAQALAAYNAGPGATDHAVASNGQNWLAAMPAETQDYVARVG
jgi:soluble lytic murein transglycosylase-like protein